jgi:hypothetical protein
MARILTLARTADFESSDIETLSLVDYTNGFQVENDGWAQVIAGDNDASVMETMSLMVNGTSHNSIAANVGKLDKLLAKGKWYAESEERYGLWLRAKLPDETNSRQSLVVNSGRGQVSTMDKPTSPGNLIRRYPLTLERTPLWEATTDTDFSYTAVNMIGGINIWSTAVVGTDSARIASMTIQGADGIHAAEYWIGFRTSKNGVLANFVSPWELELGTHSTDTSDTTDANASPGGAGKTKMSCTFATTTTLESRVTLTPYQISSTNYTDLRGTFDILLRAKCASGRTASVRLSSGLSGTSYRYCNPVTVTGTTYKIYYLGRITLPAGGKVPSSFDPMRWSIIQLEASLTAGATDANALDMDCLIPIPVDEGYGYIVTKDVGASTDTVKCLVGPSGMVGGYEYWLNSSLEVMTAIPDLGGISPDKFCVPVGNFAMIVAAQDSVLSDTVSGTIQIVPRWRTLRGSE